jgi:hypothetical protein
MSVVVFATVPNDQIEKDAKEAIPKIETWFKQHPTRRICATGLWYGKVYAIRKGHVEEDVNEAAKAAKK